jgi:3-hydroxyisobutyrate dehydrogenase-like beta-hydroxyacid dehydrogenase
MKASEARERMKNINQQKQNNELEKIYEKIKQSVDIGWHNTFISEFNISNEHKNILENDGYFVDTRYTNGFQVRWIETDMNYFLDLVSSNKEHAKLKVDNNVIENYKRSACV